VIACGDDRDAGSQKINCNFSSYPSTACGIFAVDNDEVQTVPRLKLWQLGNDCGSTRLPNNIAKKKNG
jgi:hypothetical protein